MYSIKNLTLALSFTFLASTQAMCSPNEQVTQISEKTPDIMLFEEISIEASPISKEEKISKSIEKYNTRFKGQKFISFVDYSMPISEKRFFVFDLKKKKIVLSTHVGHSGYSGEITPFDTSNVPNTRKTSLGLYRVGVQYSGRWGKSKRLHGLSKTNSNAFIRAIVAHSMSGNKPENLYSWGCFTFYEKDLNTVFKYMKRGTYLLAVY